MAKGAFNTARKGVSSAGSFMAASFGGRGGKGGGWVKPSGMGL